LGDEKEITSFQEIIRTGVITEIVGTRQIEPPIARSIPVPELVFVIDIPVQIKNFGSVLNANNIFLANADHAPSVKGIVFVQKKIKGFFPWLMRGIFWNRKQLSHRQNFMIENYIGDYRRRVSNILYLYINGKMMDHAAAKRWWVDPQSRRSMGYFDIGSLRMFQGCSISQGGLGSVLSDFDISPHPLFLANHPNPLEKDYKDEQAIKSYQPPIGRRFLLVILSLLVGFFLSLWGWENFDHNRRLLGAALIGGGFMLGAFGLGLWWPTGFPGSWSWGWWL